ncbi:MAG: FHA domain-containing protein [Planctomycetota bacterium]|jgi:pSer/pThr/pTyr-binding forkhead associated (FHA) protein
MKTNLGLNIELMEGRSFILGREGHIYVDSPTASKHHAEISINEGRVFLRDLGSTNGTFLLKDDKLVKFDSGYVNLHQPIVIGKRTYIIEDLLVIARDFAAVDDNITRVELPEEWEKKRVTSNWPCRYRFATRKPVPKISSPFSFNPDFSSA